MTDDLEVPEPSDWSKVDAMPMEQRSKLIETLDHAIENSEKKIKLLRQLRENMLARWSGASWEKLMAEVRYAWGATPCWPWHRAVRRGLQQIEDWRKAQGGP
jgi:hypothetical protein